MKSSKLSLLFKSLFVSAFAVFFTLNVSFIPINAAEKPVKIGVLLAQTGPFTSLAAFVMDGLKLSMEEAGYKAGGRAIELIVEDEGAGDPSFALDKARKLIESDKVDIIIGPFNSDVRLATLPYTSSKKIPSFACVLDDENALKFPFAYAFNQTTFSEPRALGWYAFDKLGIKSVNTVGGDWHAGRAFIEGFVYGFTKERSGKVVSQQFTPIGNTDYSSYLVAMKKADAIAVMLLPADIGAFLSQANQMGILPKTKVLLMGQTVLPPMMKDLGPMLVGRAWGIAEYQPFYKASVNNQLVAKYIKKIGHPPSNLEGSGYTVGTVILTAIKNTRGDTSADKLHIAIKKLKMDTPMGKLSFTPGKSDMSGVQGILTRFIEEVKLIDGQYLWDLVKEYPAVAPVNK